MAGGDSDALRRGCPGWFGFPQSVILRVKADKLQFVRLAWADTHDYSRAKTPTIPAFLSARTGGYNIGVATTTLDSAGVTRYVRPGANSSSGSTTLGLRPCSCT